MIVCLYAQAISQESHGLVGHLYASVNNGQPKEGFEHGFSFYSSIHTLNATPFKSAQLGWGNWITPKNFDFAGPLCPVGTHARDHWPERGPTWRDVFQTIEGGIGQWGSTKIPYAIPKYRINTVPDCYGTQISSPGWDFGVSTLPVAKLGIAQLSNQLLIPPDGITFSPTNEQNLVGSGWIALPILPARISPNGVFTDNQNWTLFVRGANFKGPVALVINETYSALAVLDSAITGRGLDARPGYFGGAAIEIGWLPAAMKSDSTGGLYCKIPRVAFPTDDRDISVLLQDIRYYGRGALWDAFAMWIDSGIVATQLNSTGVFAPPLSGSTTGLTIAGVPVDYDGAFKGGAVTTPWGTPAFGLQWSGNLETGVIPEYYTRGGTTWNAVPASQVPQQTGLHDHQFEIARSSPVPDLDVSSTSPWNPANWKAGPYSVTLADGSRVEYVWYKFIEQPAISRLTLSEQQLQKIQAFVESLHEHSGIDGVTIDPPSSGNLASFDPALIVTPPVGFEKGYVPIAIRQYSNPSSVEIDALMALYISTGGPHWTTHSNWLTDDVGNWYGVTVQNGSVTELRLPGNNLTGQLPPDLGGLTNLKVLDLGSNHLTGTIPPEVGNLTTLRSLELSSNNLAGSLPGTIGDLTDLTFFSAYNNQLSGSIPEELGNLASLNLLQLGSNALTGSIPSTLGQLGALNYLFLGNNQLSNGLPGELGNLLNLLQLEVNDNLLAGPLPLSLQNLVNLNSFLFDNTQLCIPTDSSFQTWLQSIPTLISSNIHCTPSDAGPVVPQVPTAFALRQNFPNPFNPTTMFSFELPQASAVLLTIHNVLGQTVATVVNEQLPAGRYSRTFDAQNLASGVYFYRLTAGTFINTKKLILIR
jgi:Leucine-rich repeat (LRR) protein